MKNKLLKYTKELIVLIITVTIFTNGVSLYRSTSLNKLPLPIALHVEPKKPIMIHFWATWCPVCKTEIDNIQRLSKDYQVITIAVKSGTTQEIQTYLNERGFDFKFINDKDAVLAQKFGVNIYPTTIIYNQYREVVFSDIGYTSTFGLYLRMWWAS